jgi:penicillin-insensitive murein DD-endopeptidase
MLKKSAIWDAEQPVKPDTKPVSKKSPLRLADLPKDCGTVLTAGGHIPLAADAEMPPAALQAMAAKDAGPAVPRLDPAALKLLVGGADSGGMPLPDRNPAR